MPGNLRLPAVVLRRARAEWTVLGTAFLLLTCATTLLTAGVVYGDTVANAGLRRALGAEPIKSQTVDVQGALRIQDLAAADEVISTSLGHAVAASGGSVDLVMRSEAYAPASAAPTDGSQLVILASYGELPQHAALVAGRWSVAGQSPLEATLSEGAAVAIGVKPGDRLPLVNRVDGSLKADVVVVGTWRATAGDGYWLGDALERDGTQTTGSFTKRGPVVLERSDFATAMGGRQVSVDWRGVPRIESMTVDDVRPLSDGLAQLATDITVGFSRSQHYTIVTDLPGALASISRALLVSRSGVLVLTIEFAVLAAYAVILVGSLLVDRRRAEAALLQTRGASRGHLALVALLEALLLAAPAAIVAPLLALGVVALLGHVGPLADTGMLEGAAIDQRAVLTAALTGVGCVAMLVVPSIIAVISPAGARASLGRPIARTLAQRLGIDLVLLVIAGLALWQLHTYGGTLTQNVGGALGVDPLLVAAPAIGLLAGAVAATRFLPRAAEIGERLFRRRSGLTGQLGARQLARRPLRYTRSALLLLLATALGTFAAIYGATWTQANGDEAAYRAPADQRVVMTDYPAVPSWAVGPALRMLPAVTDAEAVQTMSFSAGRSISDGDLVAVDPAGIQRVLSMPRDLVNAGIPGLIDRFPEGRPAALGPAVPDGSLRLGVFVDSHMVSAFPPIGDVHNRSLSAIAVIQNADGIFKVTGTPGDLTGDGQVLEFPLTSAFLGRDLTAAFPIHLAAIELTIRPPANVPVTGEVTVRSLVASSAAAGTDWQPLSAAGVEWTSEGTYGTVESSAGVLMHVVISDREPIFSGNPAPVMRLAAQTQLPAEIPAIVNDTFLENTGTAIGDAVLIRARSQVINLRIIGSTPAFPPLDPSRSLAVIDATTLAAISYSLSRTVTSPREWWLSTSSPQDFSRTLIGTQFGAKSVVSKTELLRSLNSDPVPIGLVGALILGALASLGVAALGFLMSSTASATERTGEFALLRALGLSGRSVSGWLLVENAVLLLFGAAVGVGLGLLLAWLVLPFATLTQSGGRPATPPEVVVPWAVLISVVVAVVAGLVAGTRLLSRPVTAGRLAAVLRTRDL